MTAPSTTTIRPDITLFAPIDLAKAAKQSDGTLIVSCVVSTESPDDQGEYVTYDALKKASADYMQWANVREMHQPSAVGTTIELSLDDTLRKASAELHIVDPVAVTKVETGVYKGVSIGGRKTGYGKLEKTAGGKNVRPVTGIEWIEISLADRPSNPDTVLTLAKRSDLADETPAADPAAAEPDLAADPATDAPAAAEPVAPDVEATATAGVEPAAPSEPLEQAAATGDLQKAAADDVRDAAWILSDLNRLIETEAAEGDTEGVTQLKAAQAAMVAFVGTESAEVGTPEDVAQAEAEKPLEVVIVDPFYYAAVTGDLAKRAVTLAKAAGVGDPDPQLDTLISLARSAGGRCDHDLAKVSDSDTATPIDGDALAKLFDAGFERSSDALLMKVTSAIGSIVRPDALDAMKGELLEAMAPLKEELAKIAAQPAPGGPARYAVDARRFGGAGEFSPASEAEVLSKAAAASTDPVVREALGLMAATAQIRDQQTGA